MKEKKDATEKPIWLEIGEKRTAVKEKARVMISLQINRLNIDTTDLSGLRMIHPTIDD